jgi:hypothetical protein
MDAVPILRSYSTDNLRLDPLNPMSHSQRNLGWYLQRTAHYEIQANRATNPEAKRKFLDVADIWRQLAKTYAPVEIQEPAQPFAPSDARDSVWASFLAIRPSWLWPLVKSPLGPGMPERTQ